MEIGHCDNSRGDPLSPVAFARCGGYSRDEVGAAVAKALGALGGIGSFGLAGKRVLVKPNLLCDRPPEDAVTTHPEILRAVIRMLKAVGADVRVGDSPASAVLLRRVWEKTGTEAVCREEGVPLVSFEGGEMRLVRRDGIELLVAAEALDSDMIVNLPKVKTHGMTFFTCGVKKFYGLLPGYQKTRRHREHPNPLAFARLLRALLAETPPQICIADGVVGMEGEGPSNGTPVRLGFIAASRSPVALDIAICRKVGIPVGRVPYLADDADALPPELGDLPADYRARMRPPSTWKSLAVPAPVAKFCARWLWVRPSFDAVACKKCGRCAAACPKNAIAFEKGQTPALGKPRECVGCCCCHEVCPVGAIHMRTGPLLRLAGVFSELRSTGNK